MGSATARRFALVAVMVVLVPVWFRPVTATHAPAQSDELFLGMAAASAAPGPAIRRIADSWPSSAPVHGLATVTLATMLALLFLAGWARRCAATAGASPLDRRRHVIALRGPPAAATLLSSS